jgi:hypothetical protein
MKNNIEVRKNYHLVKLDQTEHWNKRFLSEIGPDAKIISAYVFDRNAVTYCCEATASYELHLAGTEFITSREMSDQEKEEIEERVRCGSEEGEDIEYHHCGEIDNISQPIGKFKDCDDDTTIDDVIEYYAGNPW